MRLSIKVFFFNLWIVGSPAIASEPVTGPVIDNYGPVFAVPQGSYNLLPDQQYKVVMDVGKGPEDPAELNRSIESAARFLNMQARNGTPPENLKMAVVLHGAATYAQAGEVDHAFEWLEKAVDQGSLELVYLGIRPEFDPLRGDPRYSTLLQRLGLLNP
jgi:hypothetical protein